jgi:hypothetical protein
MNHDGDPDREDAPTDGPGRLDSRGRRTRGQASLATDLRAMSRYTTAATIPPT